MDDSVLENLSIGMVSQIPLDYMHLVCLGVTKKVLQLWMKTKRTVGLSTENLLSTSDRLIAIRPYIPAEFARKPRSLQDLDRWKATKFRQFLLYTAVVVLKSIMPPTYYDHFVSLSVAIRILDDHDLCKSLNAYTNSLLVWFVSNFGQLYGKKHISYNIHNLIHLANDVKVFGCLDNFSCFKFKNYMQKIKKKLHQSEKPLQELANKMIEESQILIQPHDSIMQYPIAVYKNKSELEKISHVQFKTFKIANN